VVLADDYYLEDKLGVRRVVGHVMKSANNPLVSADQPWEDSINWAHVIFDDKAGVYRMWYTVWNSVAYHERNERYPAHSPERARAIAEANKKHWYAYFLCHATSRDGKHWEKPALGLHPFRNYLKTNIVMVGETEVEQTNIWLNDDQSNPARRFLMTYTDNLVDQSMAESLMLAYSADGTHWEVDREASPLLTHDTPDGSYQTIYNRERKIWMMYRRPDYHSAATVREPGPFAGVPPQRRYGVSVNNRLGPGWSYPGLVLVPDEAVARRDIDTMYVFREGTDYIGLLGEMDDREEGVQEVHLALSHDGLNWSWFPYLPPLIPRGAKGSWDAGQVQPPKNIVPAGEFTYTYYTGVNVGQRVEAGYESNIGMCRIRTGRWIGLASDENGGYVLSRQMVVTGNRLQVNYQGINGAYMKPVLGRYPRGYIQVELLRRDQETLKLKPIPGFTFAESDPLTGDGAETAATWKGKGDLSSLKGTPVHVRFRVVQSELWEMRFADAD
jgi:hypothetical protein